MNTIISCITVAVLTFLAVAWAYRFEPPERFWKRPKRPQVPAKPGTIIELVADDGHVIGVLQLHSISRALGEPMVVVFKDFTAFMTDRRVRPRGVEYE